MIPLTNAAMSGVVAMPVPNRRARYRPAVGCASRPAALTGWCVEGGHRHPHRVDEARLRRVHRGRRQMVELDPGREIDHASYHRIHDVDLLVTGAR